MSLACIEVIFSIFSLNVLTHNRGFLHLISWVMLGYKAASAQSSKKLVKDFFLICIVTIAFSVYILIFQKILWLFEIIFY